MSTSNEGRNVKMLFRILKKDLKRKKVMNAILLCFILLATMFVASGISNVVSVMNGTDSYLDKAEIGDYVVISMGADSKASIDEILHEMESIRDYRIEPVVFGEKSNLKDMHGEKLEAKNSVIYQSIEDLSLIHILLYQKGKEPVWFEGKRIDNPNTHGTGCTLSSAIASNLAKGRDLETSVKYAKNYISGALAAMLDLGKGSGPMDHAFAIEGEY